MTSKMKTTSKWRQPQKWRPPQKWRQHQKLRWLKNENNLKCEDDLYNEDNLKNWPSPPKNLFCPPPLPLKNNLKFFWWLLTVTATPQLMLNRKWYQGSKPEMEFHMMNIIYAALSISAQAKKTTFSCKDDCTLTKHKWCWTYSALRYFFILNKPEEKRVL